MADPRISFQSRTISFDFDGVLASLVLGKRWAKTRKKKSPIPLVSAAVRALELGVGSLTERLQKEALSGTRPGDAGAAPDGRADALRADLARGRADRRRGALARPPRLAGVLRASLLHVDGEDADALEELTVRAHPIDIHVDDDPGTIAHLAPLFPDMLFVHLDHERGPEPAGREHRGRRGLGRAGRSHLQPVRRLRPIDLSILGVRKVKKV